MGISGRKNGWVLSLILAPALLVSCAKKSDINGAQGDLQVQIGVQRSASSYNLQVVTLKSIEKLSEVAGQFARFFYAPGSTSTTLTGSAPRAEFIRSGGFFVPSDTLSMQMATIYFHLQSLAAFDKEVGAEGINHWPRAVGLETQISNGGSDAGSLQQNNAFYNGQTDSMMFVPFNGNNLPIAVNAGIIAHEHFHSLFYKLVIRSAFQAQKVSSSAASIHEEARTGNRRKAVAAAGTTLTALEQTKMFNETFLRGINEGFADFWGWVYTDDPEFMRWSLPDFQADRTLTLPDNKVGVLEGKDRILRKINETVQFYDNPQAVLVNYSYQIGTPYARFLKQFSVLQATAKNISIAESKKLVAQIVFNYIKELGQHVQSLSAEQSLDPLSLFDYVAKLAQSKELVRLDQSSCEFLVKYASGSTCKSQKDSSFLVSKP